MRLPAISAKSQAFSILGLDQILAFAQTMGIGVSSPDDLLQLEKIVSQMMTNYTPITSGVVISPELGFSAVLKKDRQSGPLFCLERRLIEPDPLTVPLLLNNWNVEYVRHNYGVAKLELYYNPLEEEAATKRQMVAELFDYCQQQKIDFLLDLIVVVETTQAEYQQTFQQLQLEAIQDLRRSCSLMAIEYPLDTLGAVTVTAELDIPWILSGHDTPYDQFKQQLRAALDSGAQGYLAAQQFLPPATQKEKLSLDSVLEFIQTDGRDRVVELTRIVTEAASTTTSG